MITGAKKEVFGCINTRFIKETFQNNLFKKLPLGMNFLFEYGHQLSENGHSEMNKHSKKTEGENIGMFFAGQEREYGFICVLMLRLVYF